MALIAHGSPDTSDRHHYTTGALGAPSSALEDTGGEEASVDEGAGAPLPSTEVAGEASICFRLFLSGEFLYSSRALGRSFSRFYHIASDD